MSVAAVRDHLADALNRVAQRSERVLLKRGRKAVAALVSVRDLAVLEAMEDKADVRAARKALKEKGGITLEEYKRRRGI